MEDGIIHNMGTDKLRRLKEIEDWPRIKRHKGRKLLRPKNTRKNRKDEEKIDKISTTN